MKNLKAYATIIALGSALSIVAHTKYRHDLSAALDTYRTEEKHASELVGSRFETTLREMYHGIRTIARLPGVRTLGRGTEDAAFDLDARQTVQEIYNNLAVDVAMSEVYVVPVGFEPDAIDPDTGVLQTPIASFDELIVGRSAEASKTAQPKAHNNPAEIEIYEYRLMKQQLAWMRAHVPTEDSISGLAFPAVGGPEVVTCDNRRFFPSAPNDRDRSGLVYSVPFFGFDGELKGCVSGVILTHALRDLLPSGNYAVVSPTYGTVIESHAQGQLSQSMDYAKIGEPDPDLLYSEARSMDVVDGSGTWTLWSGVPDTTYWHRSDVQSARKAIAATQTAIWVLSIGLCLFVYSTRRSTSAVAAANAMLEERVRARTAALEEAGKQLAAKNTKIEDALQEAQNTRLALDQHAIVSVTKTNGQITHINDKFCDISGYSREELLGKNHRLVKSDEHSPAFYKTLWRTILSGEVWHGEVRNRCKDGSHYWVDATIVPFRNAGGKLEQFVAIRTDVTRVKEAERKAKAMNVRLKELNADLETARAEATLATNAKSNFLANMSHEIRTPMTAILGFSENLRDGGLSKPEERDAIETICKNGDYLLGLINDILDVSKIEAGKMEVEHIPCSVRAIIEDVTSLMIARSNAKNLVFKTEIIGPLPETILSDPTKLKQILINIIGNAIKFTDEGGVRLVTRFVPGDSRGREGTREAPFVQFDIVDTGVGLTEAQADNLFQAFSQADSTMTRRFGGTGLGLVISKKLARMLGGDVLLIDSQPGCGTRFRTTIATGSIEGVRIVDQLESALSTPPATPSETRPTCSPLNCRILVADDGIDNQRLISFILKKAGADTTIAENGQVAFDLAMAAERDGQPFDVVLMDMQMPVLDGYKATTALRSAGYNRPIIALTAHAMEQDRARCIDAGCDDYATKPIDRKKLISIIHEHLSRSAIPAGV